MTTYRIFVMHCPGCGSKFVVHDVSSCNTFGATTYTDGSLEGPMYDERGPLLICPECEKLFWRDDVSIFKSMRGSEYYQNSRRRTLPSAKPILAHQFEEAMLQHFWSNKEQEIYIRVKSWWAFNHAFRSITDQDYSLSAHQENNVRELARLLDSGDQFQSIMKAEIYRELGEFDACLRELDKTFDNSYSKAVNTICQLARAGSKHPAKIEH